MDFIRFGHPSKKVHMTAQHRQLRLEWARQQLQSPTDWTKVFFADEKKWELDGPVRRGKVLYDCRHPRPVLPRSGARNAAVHVWGAFSLTTVPPLGVISAHFNAQEYISVLAARFLPFSGSGIPVFLHDKHPAHKCKQTMKWLDLLGVHVISLPAKSPDLNPIENVWAIVSNQVFTGMKTYSSKESLLNAVRTAWERVRADHSLRQHLIDSMTKRLQAVVKARGGPTKF